MFVLLFLEVLIFFKVDRIKPEQSTKFMICMLFYGLANLFIMFSFQVKYRGK